MRPAPPSIFSADDHLARSALLLGKAARGFDADEKVRVLVLRGAGDEAFVSGADISQFPRSAGDEAAV